MVRDSMTADAADDRSGWMVLPTPEHAAAWATPFPDFDAAGEWEARAAVHDLNVDHMVRLAEEATEA